MKRIVVGASGRIALPKAVKDDKKIMLITAEVFVPENMDARLMIGGNVNLRVAVKEANVYVGMPGKGAARADMVEVDVVLIPGSNRIIVSTTYEDVAEPAVYLRFLDPDRKLRYPDRGIAVGK